MKRRAPASGGPSGEGLTARLAAGEIVRLPERDWTAAAGEFTVVQETPTAIAGSILLVRFSAPGRRGRAWGLVEQPEPGQRVVRPLAGRAQGLTLIGERLAAYERMWDG